MREIKFRGWDIKNSKWIYGSLIEKIKPTEVERVFWGYLIHDGALSAELVAKDSVGQYTGLKDKNGTPIFEGDIVRKRKTSTPEYVGEVFYTEVRCAFAVRYDRPSGFPRYADLVKCKWSESDGYHVIDTEGDKDEAHEVIGNIHSNPELLTPTP